jgi:hypothetical protein
LGDIAAKLAPTDRRSLSQLAAAVAFSSQATVLYALFKIIIWTLNYKRRKLLKIFVKSLFYCTE